jgi:hypothetical protein
MVPPASATCQRSFEMVVELGCCNRISHVQVGKILKKELNVIGAVAHYPRAIGLVGENERE